MRHLRTKDLWLQEEIRQSNIKTYKIASLIVPSSLTCNLCGFEGNDLHSLHSHLRLHLPEVQHARASSLLKKNSISIGIGFGTKKEQVLEEAQRAAAKEAGNGGGGKKGKQANILEHLVQILTRLCLQNSNDL